MTRAIPAPRKKTQTCNSIKETEPRNEAQASYIASIEENVITFGIGPAGTGKTYLAMYQALHHLWNKKTTGIKRIILTRPVVEAGEKLGFLPGDLEDKMDPYMRPLYDALYDFVGVDTGREKVQKGIIEIAPVAFMRGRTFSDAVIIMDEAQNCSFEQLMMVATRLGENVKLIISGDAGQSDLSGKSGLVDFIEALSGTTDVGIVRFGNKDVSRSKIVRDVLISIGKHKEGKVT